MVPTDNEQSWMQKTLQTVATGLLMAAIIGVVAVRDTAIRNTDKVDNLYIAFGEAQKEKAESRKERIEITKAMAIVTNNLVTLQIQMAMAQDSIKELKKEMRE